MIKETLPPQHFVKEFVSWEQYRVISDAFADIPLVRLIYCEGALEIMTISLRHEVIVTLLNTLLMNYFVQQGLWFRATGAYTQSVPSKTEYQSDLSFNFGTAKEVSDLCIEVVITSGGINKLRKYELRGVPEVWFWEEGKFSIFYLQDGHFIQLAKSHQLPALDLEHLEACLLMDSQMDAMLAFQRKYNC
jgi:Uma2 family endonuclease